MKKMKRIISFMMCASMIASFLAVSAFAENTADKGGLSVDKTVVTTQGKDKTITVTSEIPAIAASDVTNVTMSIKFDNNVLEYVSSAPDKDIFKITEGGTSLGNVATSVATANKNGELVQAVTVAGGSVDLSAGHTTQITFKVKDGAAVGSTTLQYNMKKLRIKSETTSYVPADWNTEVKISVASELPDSASPWKIKTEPAKNVYSVGDTFDPTGLVITVTNSDGSQQDIAYSEENKSKFTFAPTTLTKGTTEVTVTYEGMSAKITGIVVTDKQGDNNNQGSASLNFSDVRSNAYYYDAVNWAVQKGITTGTSKTTFSPNSACTRAQIVTFLWRAAGSPEAASTGKFSDVSSSDYFAKAVAWAVEKGITTGTSDTKFSPNSACTRAQAVTFLCRAVGTQGQAGSSFTDVSSSAYYAGPVAWAVANGVTDGVGNGKFAPNDNCTRAQIVTFLYRAYQGK